MRPASSSTCWAHPNDGDDGRCLPSWGRSELAGELPLINPGGETGDTTGWTVVLGTSFRVETNGLSSTPEIQSSQRNPYAGSWCLAHTATTGINAPGIVYQDVALDGLSASRLADIDAGKVTARVEGFLLTDAGGTDRGCTELHFYTSGGVWLGGCLFDTMNRDNAWGTLPMARSKSRPVPGRSACRSGGLPREVITAHMSTGTSSR